MAKGVAHLEDEEIDLYASRRLDPARVQEVEEHYLDCPACLARVCAAKERVARGGSGSTAEQTT